MFTRVSLRLSEKKGKLQADNCSSHLFLSTLFNIDIYSVCLFFFMQRNNSSLDYIFILHFNINKALYIYHLVRSLLIYISVSIQRSNMKFLVVSIQNAEKKYAEKQKRRKTKRRKDKTQKNVKKTEKWYSV